MTSIMVVVTLYLIISNTFFGVDNNNFSTHALTYYFFMGMLFFHWKEYIFANWKLFGVAVVASYVFLSMPNTVYFAPIFVTYMTVFLGVRGLPEFKWLKTRDYSYGIYLYGSPIAQAVLASAPSLRGHGILVFILAVACTLAFAAMSWHLIERRALALKSRLPQAMTAKKVAMQAAAAE